MKISNVAITLITPQYGLIAFAAITLDGAFHVGGIAPCMKNWMEPGTA